MASKGNPMLVIEILFIVFMVLWLVAFSPPAAPWAWAANWLAFVCVALLGLAVFLARGLP
jgi:hypothetical protein